MPWKLGIVGMGPRGLSLLERLSSLQQDHFEPIELHLFEPGQPGCGVHATDQPEYLLANTVCSQITAFGINKRTIARPIGSPSLFEWARARQYEVAEGDGVNHLVHENDYLPRAVLGKYLSWAFEYIVRNLPDSVSVTLHQQEVTDIRVLDRHKYHILGINGLRVEVNGLAITTGHSSCGAPGRSPRSAHAPAHPVDRMMDRLGSTDQIGIEGMGLTALDTITAATVGRGGQFTREGGRLRYRPSGREPKLVCFSRSGVPLLARARNQKPLNWDYQPFFTTTQATDRLRDPYGGGSRAQRKLDFAREVLPLVNSEMELMYYSTLIRRTMCAERAERFVVSYLSGGPKSAEVRAILAALPTESRWDLASLMAPAPQDVMVDGTRYRQWLIEKMRDDVDEARVGNIDSPIKAACDVLRDIRPILRHVVEHGGLTPESHQSFLTDFVPVMNRLAVGPPLQKIEELAALVEAEIVDVGLGRALSVEAPTSGKTKIYGSAGTRQVDKLVRTHLPLLPAVSLQGGIIEALLRAGVARAFTNGGYEPGGLDVTPEHRLVSHDGHSTSPIWALGTPIEGPRFYTFVLSAPGAARSPLQEAQECAEDILRTAQTLSAAVPSARGDATRIPTTPQFSAA
ncbi:FAD/NAD(P)-binding protein [Peteryoungia ipomoeae]|uniref:FAD/NAD(P)-binding protein n=2 Tax=Peteryoungia ipomoeae TaxID=1210932 RepID=A0A4S8NR83_9HYPH|nr:FAD/NAD(P)-binding protein [Peteryoungia ipomoeae]